MSLFSAAVATSDLSDNSAPVRPLSADEDVYDCREAVGKDDLVSAVLQRLRRDEGVSPRDGVLGYGVEQDLSQNVPVDLWASVLQAFGRVNAFLILMMTERHACLPAEPKLLGASRAGVLDEDVLQTVLSERPLPSLPLEMPPRCARESLSASRS